MFAFKNVTDTDLEVMIDGRRIVATAASDDAPASEFKVPDEWVPSLASQPNFAPADDATQEAVDDHLATFEVPEVESVSGPEVVTLPKGSKITPNTKPDKSDATEEKN